MQTKSSSWLLWVVGILVVSYAIYRLIVKPEVQLNNEVKTEIAEISDKLAEKKDEVADEWVNVVEKIKEEKNEIRSELEDMRQDLQGTEVQK